MASNRTSRQRRNAAYQQPAQQVYNGQLPKDPNFVNTWDNESNPNGDNNYKDPIDYSKDYPEQPPVDAPVQRREPTPYNEMVAIQEPVQQEPTLGSRSYQSFQEYAQPFMSESRESRQTYDASPYQTAYDSQVGSINQLATNNASQVNVERQRAIEEAKAQAADETKQIEETYDPNLQVLKQSLSDRGILDSSAAGQKLIKLLTDNQDSVKRVQESLTKRTQEIEQTYSQRSAQIQQQTQAAIADQQSLLAQRLDALQKDKRVAEESKKQFEYQIYKDYQNQLDSIEQQNQEAQQQEQKMRQQAFDNELALANLTGSYQGQPTYKADQAAIDNELAQAKFEIAQLKKTGGGGGSGGGAGSNADVQQGISDIQALIAQGYTPEDAYALVSGRYSAAGKRALSQAFISAATTPVQPAVNPAAKAVLPNLPGVGGLLSTGLNALFGGKSTTAPQTAIQLTPAQRKTLQDKASAKKTVYNDPF